MCERVDVSYQVFLVDITSEEINFAQKNTENRTHPTTNSSASTVDTSKTGV